MPTDNFPMQLAQKEKAAGELRALYSLMYDGSKCGGGTRYQQIKAMVEDFLMELDSEF